MNINFTGKFVLYGQKETIEKAKAKMMCKSERFESLDINFKEHKMTIATTGKDTLTLKEAKQNANFKEEVCEIVRGNKKDIIKKLVNYLFGTEKNIPLLNETALNEILRNKQGFEDIEYNNGLNPLIKNKQHLVRYVDGSTRLFSKKGLETELCLKDGTSIRETMSGAKTYTYPTGIVEKFNCFNRLLSRKYPNGTEEFFGTRNGRIKTRILPDGKKINFCYYGDKLTGVLDENNNQGRIDENGNIVWLESKNTPERTLSSTQEGVWMKITRSGVKQKCLKNQILEEIFPDGRIKRYNEKGITEIHPDGTITYLDKFGRPIFN